MRRWIASVLALSLMAMPLLALDKSADEKGNDRATQFKQLQKDFQKAADLAQKDLQGVKTQEEFNKIVVKLKKEYTARIVKLVEQIPKISCREKFCSGPSRMCRLKEVKPTICWRRIGPRTTGSSVCVRCSSPIRKPTPRKCSRQFSTRTRTRKSRVSLVTL